MTAFIKTAAGRLREAGVARIHELRDAYDDNGDAKPGKPKRTLQSIAAELGLSLGTVYNVCAGKTHRDLHPALSRGKPVRQDDE